MYEKISETHLREEKVRKVKEKILEEIEKAFDINRFFMEARFEDGIIPAPHEWRDLIEKEYFLIKLKDFIESKNCFMKFNMKYEEYDAIVWTIPDINLNIWLQDNYNFTTQFIAFCKRHNCCVCDVLDEEFLAYDFISLIDKQAYKQNCEAKNN